MKITATTELKDHPEAHDTTGGQGVAKYKIMIDGEYTGVRRIVTSKMVGNEAIVEETYEAVVSPEDKMPTVHESVVDALRAAGHEVEL